MYNAIMKSKKLYKMNKWTSYITITFQLHFCLQRMERKSKKMHGN